MKKTVAALFIAANLTLIVYSGAFAQTAQTTNRGTSASSNSSTGSLGALLSGPQSGNLMQMYQTLPPDVQAKVMAAVQKGDLEGAKKIYLEYTARSGGKGAQGTMEQETASKTVTEDKPSIFETTLSGEFPTEFLKAPLKQFGYDTFRRTAESFVPSYSTPVGPDYILGPGDQFTMTLWGTAEGIFNFTVTKEGLITLPKVGVVRVAGVRFGDIEHTLKKHLSRYYANFNLSVAIGELKTVSVYVVGEVENPGSYTVSSLTTVYGGLFAAGGPTKRGSLRTIQVLRSGKIIKTLDLYDFFLRGDRSRDFILQQEDTIFVPLIGPVVGAAGSVYRPAIYELAGGETIEDVVRYAGGIMPIGLGNRVQVHRFQDNQKKKVMDITIASSKLDGTRQKVLNMDTITVFPVYDKIWEKVNLAGEVRHPGDYEFRPSLTVKDVVLMGELLPTSDNRKAEVIRLTDNLMDRQIIPVDIDAILKGDVTQNIPLRSQDMVRIYTTFKESEKIKVTGEVVRPGEYEITKGDRLSDLIKRIGGFTAEAYPYGAIFKRKSVKDSEEKNLKQFIGKMQSQMAQAAAATAATAISSEEASFAKAQFTMNQTLLTNLQTLSDQLEGRIALNIEGTVEDWASSSDDLLLQDGDTLYIPKYAQEIIVLGETYSPGAQVFVPKMTVGEYIERSGGITKYADADQVFVVQANGVAFGADSPSIGNIHGVHLKAGDTVFVPQKVERYAIMRFTRDIIDILFKTAVALATITVIF